MKYGSVCSGIEAATAAWHDLGWKPQFFSEIEKFPSAVLKHHYPDVLNHGDMEKFNEWSESDIDVLVGGTPCQSFSVAGLREGMADPRGNLALTYLALADRYAPPWIVWENVPGVLSSGEGRDFGSFLGGLAELGYGWAYRVLDAQYFGVPQRRRRVFVVGYLGDWRPAVQVLFERESLFRHPAPSREQGQRTASSPAECTEDGGEVAYPITTKSRKDRGEVSDNLVAGALATNTGPNGHDAGNFMSNQAVDAGYVIPIANSPNGNSGRQQVEQTYIPEISNAIASRDEKGVRAEDGVGVTAFQHNAGMEADGYEDVSPTMKSQGASIPAIAFKPKYYNVAVAFSENQRGEVRTSEMADSLKGGGGKPGQGYPAIAFETRIARNDRGGVSDVVPPLTAQADQGDSAPCVAFTQAQAGDVREGDVHSPLLSHPQSETSSTQYGIRNNMVVRRLTPMECERLQGFPDGYTKIAWRGKPAADCPDGPRYKALGNSMAVPVMRWIGQRIQMVHEGKTDV